MNDKELLSLLLDIESDFVERKASLSEPDRIREAICTFANDLHQDRKQGFKNVGPTARKWRKEWQDRRPQNPVKDLVFSQGGIEPLGYIIYAACIKREPSSHVTIKENE